MNAIPDDFGIPKEDFYASAGVKTNSGIIFNKTAGGKNGIVSVKNNVGNVVNAQISLYSGRVPAGYDWQTWDSVKRSEAANFKQNKSPILVSTKAFGMGIDKPNVRYSIHCGMPSSLESFYQEAGRTGRDRKAAISYIIFSEYDALVTDKLLNPERNIEEVRLELKKIAMAQRDDGSNSLWFHLNSFSGIQDEVDSVDFVLNKLLPDDRPKVVEIPFEEKNWD